VKPALEIRTLSTCIIRQTFFASQTKTSKNTCALGELWGIVNCQERVARGDPNAQEQSSLAVPLPLHPYPGDSRECHTGSDPHKSVGHQRVGLKALGTGQPFCGSCIGSGRHKHVSSKAAEEKETGEKNKSRKSGRCAGPFQTLCLFVTTLEIGALGI